MDILNNPAYVLVEGCRIVFKNFSGRPTPFNAPGNRNFVLVLTPDIASALRANGWNVGELRPFEPGDAPIPKLNVHVNMESNWPPTIEILPSDMRNRVPYDGTMVSELDRMQFATWPETKFSYCGNVYGDKGSPELSMPYYRVDMVLHRSKNGGAYLTSFRGVIQEDPLEAKYADVPMGG